MSAELLLEGAVYALEQCGLLLRDAGILFQRRSFASAVVLAAFGREELGRSRILIDLAERTEAGETFTVRDVEKHCEDHLTKQRWGNLSVVQSAKEGTMLFNLHRAVLQNPPNSEEFKKATAELETLTASQRKRAPEERHNARMSALYVEPEGTGWSRPNQVTEQEALKFVQDAINDYRLVLRGNPESKLNKFIIGWTEAPTLPDPDTFL